MNIFKKAYARTYQTIFKFAIPIMPYREPKILKSNEEVVEKLNERGILF